MLEEGIEQHSRPRPGGSNPALKTEPPVLPPDTSQPPTADPIHRPTTPRPRPVSRPVSRPRTNRRVRPGRRQTIRNKATRQAEFERIQRLKQREANVRRYDDDRENRQIISSWGGLTPGPKTGVRGKGKQHPIAAQLHRPRNAGLNLVSAKGIRNAGKKHPKAPTKKPKSKTRLIPAAEVRTYAKAAQNKADGVFGAAAQKPKAATAQAATLQRQTAAKSEPYDIISHHNKNHIKGYSIDHERGIVLTSDTFSRARTNARAKAKIGKHFTENLRRASGKRREELLRKKSNYDNILRKELVRQGKKKYNSFQADREHKKRTSAQNAKTKGKLLKAAHEVGNYSAYGKANQAANKSSLKGARADLFVDSAKLNMQSQMREHTKERQKINAGIKAIGLNPASLKRAGLTLLPEERRGPMTKQKQFALEQVGLAVSDVPELTPAPKDRKVTRLKDPLVQAALTERQLEAMAENQMQAAKEETKKLVPGAPAAHDYLVSQKQEKQARENFDFLPTLPPSAKNAKADPVSSFFTGLRQGGEDFVTQFENLGRMAQGKEQKKMHGNIVDGVIFSPLAGGIKSATDGSDFGTNTKTEFDTAVNRFWENPARGVGRAIPSAALFVASVVAAPLLGVKVGSAGAKAASTAARAAGRAGRRGKAGGGIGGMARNVVSGGRRPGARTQRGQGIPINRGKFAVGGAQNFFNAGKVGKATFGKNTVRGSKPKSYPKSKQGKLVRQDNVLAKGIPRGVKEPSNLADSLGNKLIKNVRQRSGHSGKQVNNRSRKLIKSATKNTDARLTGKTVKGVGGKYSTKEPSIKTVKKPTKYKEHRVGLSTKDKKLLDLNTKRSNSILKTGKPKTGTKTTGRQQLLLKQKTKPPKAKQPKTKTTGGRQQLLLKKPKAKQPKSKQPKTKATGGKQQLLLKKPKAKQPKSKQPKTKGTQKLKLKQKPSSRFRNLFRRAKKPKGKKPKTPKGRVPRRPWRRGGLAGLGAAGMVGTALIPGGKQADAITPKHAQSKWTKGGQGTGTVTKVITGAIPNRPGRSRTVPGSKIRGPKMPVAVPILGDHIPNKPLTGFGPFPWRKHSSSNYWSDGSGGRGKKGFRLWEIKGVFEKSQVGIHWDTPYAIEKPPAKTKKTAKKKTARKSRKKKSVFDF